MPATLTIGLIGDYNPAAPSHPATNDAIAHAASALGLRVDARWIGTEPWTDPASLDRLNDFHGLWASPGTPYRSLNGALAAIRHARERGLPFTGT